MSLLLGRTAWVFDLDGTLTVAQHDFGAIRAELGIPPGTYILEYLDSLPSVEAAPLRARLDAIERDLAASARAAQGARDLLEHLVGAGCALGILTRNTRATALASLAASGLAAYFAPAAVLGRDEAPPKPAPDGILSLLGHWRVAPTAAVMVGDYWLDLAAGRGAGVVTVHVNADPALDWSPLTDLRVSRHDQLLPAL